MNKERPGAAPSGAPLGTSLRIPPVASLRSAALWRAPAVQAALIQSGCFLIVLGIAHGASLLGGAQITVAVAAILQGTLAAGVSRMRGMASWWLLIQLLFPIALVAALALQLPPVIFLIAFVALLGWYWSTYRTQVPFYPSGRSAWQAVEDLLPKDRQVRFIDIGSGLGGLVLYLSQRNRRGAFTGIEIAPLPWFASRLRAWFSRSSARFVRGDYGRVDFADYDVVFAYLSPAAMPALWRKAEAEMRPGSLLLSYEFDIAGAEPDLIRMPGGDGGPLLYGWYMQAQSEIEEAAAA